MNLQFVHKGLLQVRGASPTILTVVGIAGVVTATVLACRATLKLRPVLEELELDFDIIEDNKKLITPEGAPVYSSKEIMLGKAKVCTHIAFDLTKLYGPAVIIGVVSIGAIAGGHGILLKRNAALASALTLTEKAFSSYRKAVAEEIGEEKERDIRFGKKVEQVHDTKAGVVKEVVTLDLKHSQYARYFDESSVNWVKNAAYNKMFLEYQQDWATRKLHADGYLLLNDVYKVLGLPTSSAGAVVGWAEGHGDSYVDFHMWDFSVPARQAFMEGDERSILLDFNVAGVVYDMIDKV